MDRETIKSKYSREVVLRPSSTYSRVVLSLADNLTLSSLVIMKPNTLTFVKVNLNNYLNKLKQIALSK